MVLNKSPFFAILRTFSSITRETCLQIKNKVHHVNQHIEADLMMYIHMTFSKKNHSTPFDLPIQNILLAPNPFHCFLQRASGPGKNIIIQYAESKYPPSQSNS